MISDNKKVLAEYAREQISKHLDERWTFRWNKRKKAFGICCYSKKTIELSAYMVECGESVDSMKRTVIHEIAHALTPGDHHGPRWRAKMRELGQDPSRTRAAVGATFEYKWHLKCGSCEFKAGFHRKPTMKARRSCPKCSPGRFSEQFVLTAVKA